MNYIPKMKQTTFGLRLIMYHCVFQGVLSFGADREITGYWQMHVEVFLESKRLSQWFMELSMPRLDQYQARPL